MVSKIMCYKCLIYCRLSWDELKGTSKDAAKEDYIKYCLENVKGFMVQRWRVTGKESVRDRTVLINYTVTYPQR